jgi:ureidoglycolate lyase
MTVRILEIPTIDATPDTVAPFGVLVHQQVTQAMDIPYYKGRVIEGGDLGFQYHGKACLRTAQVLPGDTTVAWLERHLLLTQLFVGLGGSAFSMILAPPNHESGADLPDLSAAQTLRFPPSSALLLHPGTWHDFPLAVDGPVTLLIANSQEVVDALQAVGEPRELHEGDVHKVSLRDRFGVSLRPVN